MSNSPPQTVQISFRCRNAACRTSLRTDASNAGNTQTKCPACGQNQGTRVDDALARERKLSRCAVCDGAEFFIRKDFPQRLGMALVVLFGLIASVFYYYQNIPATFGTLAALVVVDAAIYLFVGIVTVCYRCRAEYRGLPRDERHGGFDLATSEKYDVSAR